MLALPLTASPVQLLILAFCCLLPAHHFQETDDQQLVVGDITRRQDGDMFVVNGAPCSAIFCQPYNGSLWRQANSSSPSVDELVSVSSNSCSCACPKARPLFREDLEKCVADVTECPVAPYASGPPVQRIPFVFLPLKGQIIHPSREIKFPGIRTPVCAVSGAQFLTRRGLADLRNAIDADVPFALFRDEGRTFLQWTGEAELRARMVGRLLAVRLLCRDVSVSSSPAAGTVDLRGVFTPCVAYRVQGSPATHITNVSEVLFSPDAHSSDGAAPSGLTTSEYVAIGVSSVLLGLIYVASIFLYLHLKKRRIRNNKIDAENAKQKTRPGSLNKQDIIRGHVELDRSTDINLTGNQDGVIKSNPLLGINKHFFERDKSKDFNNEDEGSGAGCEDMRDGGNDSRTNKIKLTSALVHSANHTRIGALSLANDVYSSRDETGIERLPEENVSIIETLEGRDDRPELFRVIGTARKKLYFNPAYFEPHLLQDPPPAAIEFLTKIREVITVAKQKMATKRFQPSLHEIPEEETYQAINLNADFNHGVGSHRSSNISLKRENTRKRMLCSGCPGCDLIEQQTISDSLLQLSDLVVCNSCSTARGEKQNSVRKWLENMPSDQASFRSFNGLRSFYTSKSLCNGNANNFTFKIRQSGASVRSEPAYRTFNFPLPNFKMSTDDSKISGFTISRTEDIRPIAPKRCDNNIMPDMINEALAIDKKTENDCIEKLECLQNNLDTIDYETDSLERNANRRSLSPPTDFGELSSSQASPSLSTALPIEEEMTITNAVYKPNSPEGEESKYEEIGERKKLPNDYSLVSEVYVNNDYNFGSSPSSPSGSDSSVGSRKVKIRYDNPGRLTIEVPNPPGKLVQSESESFEPDTLDRKHSKIDATVIVKKDAEDLDSDGRPLTLELKHTRRQRQSTPPNAKDGKKPVPPDVVPPAIENIYEHPKPPKRHTKDAPPPPLPSKNDFGRSTKPRILPIKRSWLSSASVRRLQTSEPNPAPPPPPPRNQSTQTGDSINRKIAQPESTKHKIRIQVNGTLTKKKPGVAPKEDSGYLSSDSSPSHRNVKKRERKNSISESESSEYEAQSESGAESIETHSVFFGSLRKLSLANK